MSDRSRDIRELFRRRHEQHTLAVGTIEGFVKQRRQQHPDAQIEFSTDVAADREIENGSLLQVAIDEAIENAVVHNDQAHPHVEITVTELSEGGKIRVTIADDGPGIPEDQRTVIFSGDDRAGGQRAPRKCDHLRSPDRHTGINPCGVRKAARWAY